MKTRGNWQTADPIPPHSSWDPPDTYHPEECGWCGQEIYAPLLGQDPTHLCARCRHLDKLDLTDPVNVNYLIQRTIEAEDQQTQLETKVRLLRRQVQANG